MFGIDFSEILIIFGIALVVLGPEKLPKLANTIGRWVGRARSMARQFREQLDQETGVLRQGVDGLREGMRQGMDGMRAGVDGVRQGVEGVRKGMDLGPEFRVAPPTGSAASPDHAVVAGAAGVSEQILPPFDLADTHPAGLQGFESTAPSGPSAALASAAVASASANGMHAAVASTEQAPSTSPATPAQAGAQSAAAAAPKPNELPEPQQTMFWPPDGAL